MGNANQLIGSPRGKGAEEERKGEKAEELEEKEEKREKTDKRRRRKEEEGNREGLRILEWLSIREMERGGRKGRGEGVSRRGGGSRKRRSRSRSRYLSSFDIPSSFTTSLIFHLSLPSL